MNENTNSMSDVEKTIKGSPSKGPGKHLKRILIVAAIAVAVIWSLHFSGTKQPVEGDAIPDRTGPAGRPHGHGDRDGHPQADEHRRSGQ